MGQLDNKVIIITGASSGIGKQTAIRMAEEGAKIAICARRVEKLEATAELCRAAGADVLTCPCDLSRPDSPKEFVNAVVERFGTIDVLVNNATVAGQQKNLLDYTIDEFRDYMELDILGTIRMMQLCYPYLKGKESSIINMGSSSALGAPGMGAYGAVKAAIASISSTAACDWGKDGIRVNTVCPVCVTEGVMEVAPAFRDYMLKTFSDNRLGYAGDPYKDIAPVLVFLASSASRFITGQTVRVEGGEKMW